MCNMCNMCKIENCNNKVLAKGLCSKHYNQIRNHGKILEQTTREPNKIVKYEDYAEIYFNDKNCNITECTIIDIDDLEEVSKYKWHVKKERHGFLYARNNTVGPLHRFILSLHENDITGKVVDHIDHNTLNNRKENLRICTNQQNVTNSRIPKNNTSGHKGVYWAKDKHKWTAQISINNKTIYLGRYDNIEDAIEAREKATITYYKEYNYDISKDSKYNFGNY